MSNSMCSLKGCVVRLHLAAGIKKLPNHGFNQKKKKTFIVYEGLEFGSSEA